LISLASYFTFK